MPKNIMIYKAPIYRVFSDDVKLEKGIIIPTVKSELVFEDELFYSIYRSFVSFKYDCILADYDEARDFLAYSIDRNSNKILSHMDNYRRDAKEKIEFSNYLKAVSSCLYLNSKDVEEDHLATRYEFKNLKKQYKEAKKKK